jgi:lysophospholipase L1-like esterase
LTIGCPINQTATATSGGGIAVNFAAPSTSGGVAPIQVSCNRNSGSLFPVGTTQVQCTATDAATASRSCSFSVSVTAPLPQLSRTRFLAFGDSTTSGEVPVATTTAFDGQTPNYKMIVIPAASYPNQLLSLLRARYASQTSLLEVANSGLPTEWAQDGALRFPGVMTTVRPHAVLLLEGVNDLAALGTRGVQSAWRAIDTMAKEARNRGARVFIATIPPPRPTGPKAVSITLIQSLNSNIRETARGEGAVLVDVFTVLSTDVNRYISFDGLHPTEAGYQKIAETFYEAIRQDLEIR